jgi:hypothetical protein
MPFCAESLQVFQSLCHRQQRSKPDATCDQNSLAVALDLGGDPVMTLSTEFHHFG